MVKLKTLGLSRSNTPNVIIYQIPKQKCFGIFLLIYLYIMKYEFSFIIPVFNRPQEIEELLGSFKNVCGIDHCEIVIIEDGSYDICEEVVKVYNKDLHISYYIKPNTGPGDSRNYGMEKAKADYFIILDSDVLVPKDYIVNLKEHLRAEYVDCYGGPDSAHESFSDVQKAINYSMTSFWTTGGIRGRKQQKQGFQPRSFNMGLSRKAFETSGGFSQIHPGEDPDLALRLKKLRFKTSLYENCIVYHKRRVNWFKFALQMRKFGLARPILNLWHPESHKTVYYFPSVFSIGLILALLLLLLDFYWLLILYVLYFVFIFLDALVRVSRFRIAIMAVYAVFIQFTSYGVAYIDSTIKVFILKKKPENEFPKLFFKKPS